MDGQLDFRQYVKSLAGRARRIEERYERFVEAGIYVKGEDGRYHFNHEWEPKPPSTIRWIANLLRLF